MKKIVLGLILVLYTSYSSATIFEYTTGPGTLGGNYATYDSISATYNTDTHLLTWETDNVVKNGQLMDGFWLVLNDGPDNPKGDDGLAIFYADFVDSDGAGTNDQIGLWAFEYNGQNNPNSYLTEDYFGNFTPHLIDTGLMRGFALDVSEIFSNLSTDAPFGEQIGIWFHATWGNMARTDASGQLVSWTLPAQGWYDRAGRDTIAMSEPQIILLFCLGLLGLGLTHFLKRHF